MFITIISTLFPIFGIIALGMVVCRKKLLPEQTAMCINQFVYWISLPCMMFYHLGRMKPEQLSVDLFAGLYLALLVTGFIAYAYLSRFFKKTSSAATLFTGVICFPNAIFIGMPMISFLLPSDETALMLASVAAVLSMPSLIITDAKLELEKHKGEALGQVLRSAGKAFLLNPMVLAAIFGTGLSLSGLSIPLPVLNMAGMLGATASPCALFCMGMTLNGQLASFGSLPINWKDRQLPVHIGKLIIMPLVCFSVMFLLDSPKQMTGIVTLVCSMPTGISTYVLAEKYRVEPDGCSLAIFGNTMLSMFSLPLTAALLLSFGYL